jgi:hypothetical protein
MQPTDREHGKRSDLKGPTGKLQLQLQPQRCRFTIVRCQASPPSPITNVRPLLGRRSDDVPVSVGCTYRILVILHKLAPHLILPLPRPHQNSILVQTALDVQDKVLDRAIKAGIGMD